MRRLSAISLFLIITCTMVPTGRAAAQESDAPVDKAHAKKLADIRTLMDITKAGAMGEAVAQNMIPSFQNMLPQVPAEFWVEFGKEIDGDTLAELVVPIYDRNLDIGMTQITDAGLAHLAEFSQQRRLGLFATNVTDEGVANLEAALPELDVFNP